MLFTSDYIDFKKARRPRLFVRNHLFDLCDICHIGNCGLAKASFALGILFGQDMALIRVRTDNLAGFGQVKAFFFAPECVLILGM